MIGPFSSIKENKNNKVVDNWNKVFGALLFRREFNCPSLILHDSINDSVNCYFSFENYCNGGKHNDVTLGNILVNLSF